MGGIAVNSIVVREPATPPALFVALPQDPLAAEGESHWWLVKENAVETGSGGDWLELAVGAVPPRVIGLAPAADVRLAFSTPAEGAASPRQMATIARVGALEQSLGEPETLHSASVPLDDDPPAIVTAVVANSKMQEWLDWADSLVVRLDHIVPAAMVLPLREQWTTVQIGSERILGRRGLVLPDEPALEDALLNEGERPAELDPQSLDLALVRLAAAPAPDLRTGRFARRRRIVIDRARVRELALLTLAIILVTTLIAVIEIVRLDRSRAALDAETLEIARAAAGASVTLEGAEAALAARAGPAAGGSLSAGVAALLARLQPEQNVSLATLGYSGGTLNFTLSGQGPDAINRVLLALQRDGYHVTAVPRTQSDGRTFADVTLREGP
jgi:general secretion pathway protein L